MLLLLAVPSYSKRDSPIISYPDLRSDDFSNSQLLTQKEEDEIVRFVKTVHGIDHRVQEIEVKSHYEVEVKTGAINPLDFEKDREGNRLLLRKGDTQWTVVERSSWSLPASHDEGIYISDGTSELAMTARVTDAVTHKPVSGAAVQAVRVGGRNTEPLTNEHPSAMPPQRKTRRDGRVKLVAYFRAAGSAGGFSVFVGDSFLRVDAPGYQTKEVRISPIVRLDFPPKTKHCEVTIPVALTRE
jgi:hypothetical protein